MKTMMGLLITVGMAGMLVLSGCCTGVCDRAKKCGTCSGGSCGVTKVAAACVSTAGLKALLDSKVELALFDARAGKYDDGRRIPGATALNAESTAAEVTKAIKDKDMLVVTYCVNPKCPASSKLAAHLMELGYKNVLEYRGGIEGWTAAGFKVDEAAKK